ncbi:SHOCT domain-containing protein [Streptomyces bambusae]|uniref:SHOCT domain-containing protein n=1 Tax=Streptomyces bambusae TaxID=1550616 RepID=A0ABS6Z7K6_9ACTN|nr:SHOCT domain-containing protein [Streptomyces bambusae]MBW5483213.1 SHOCT domain-containing protein [Streptomyces bambusae]
MEGLVPLAYDYPVLGVFWTTLWIFLWVLWFFLLFKVILDIFRDHDLNGWAKAGWLVFVLVLPFLGVFVYVVARGKNMGRRELQHAQDQQQAMDDYIRRTAGSAGASEADQLARLSELKARGDITEEEYQQAKQRVLQ